MRQMVSGRDYGCAIPNNHNNLPLFYVFRNVPESVVESMMQKNCELDKFFREN